MTTSPIPSLRSSIGRKVRALREDRGLTQAELAKRLGLSQNRLSEVERGQGSFSAEQFLLLLRIFNVPVVHFSDQKASEESAFQNALARLGASHLFETEQALPSERLQEAETLIREVLVAGHPPRHLTALAPVLVQNLDRLNLARLWSGFQSLGLVPRFAWLAENTVEAIHRLEPALKDRRQVSKFRKAELALQNLLERINGQELRSDEPRLEDPLGAPIPSRKTEEETRRVASPISRRWGILSSLQPEDFVKALHDAQLAD